MGHWGSGRSALGETSRQRPPSSRFNRLRTIINGEELTLPADDDLTADLDRLRIAIVFVKMLSGARVDVEVEVRHGKQGDAEGK